MYRDRSKIIRRIVIIGILLLALGGGAVALHSVYTVRTVYVEGNVHYTEDEIMEHMREHAPMHERECRELQEIKEFFIDFLEQIRNNPRIMKVIQVLCSEQGDPYFVRKLQTMTYEAFLDGWDMHMMPEMSEQRKLLVFSYIISGMVSMLSTWATRAQDTPTEQVVSLLMGLMWHGLDCFAASDPKSAFPTE